LTALGLPNATTTRHCPGVASFDEPIPGSPFRGDAIRMLTAAGLDLARVSYAKQVHGAEAAQAPAGGGFAGTVDILVTVEPRAPRTTPRGHCALDRPVLLRGRRAGDARARPGLPGPLEGVGHSRPARAGHAGPLVRQRGVAPGGGRRSGARREPAPVHRLSPG